MRLKVALRRFGMAQSDGQEHSYGRGRHAAQSLGHAVEQLARLGVLQRVKRATSSTVK
jgi:hypothetical protein